MTSIRNEHHTYPPSSSEDRVDDTEIDSGPREECGVFGIWGADSASAIRANCSGPTPSSTHTATGGMYWTGV